MNAPVNKPSLSMIEGIAQGVALGDDDAQISAGLGIPEHELMAAMDAAGDEIVCRAVALEDSGGTAQVLANRQLGAALRQLGGHIENGGLSSHALVRVIEVLAKVSAVAERREAKRREAVDAAPKAMVIINIPGREPMSLTANGISGSDLIDGEAFRVDTEDE